MVDQTELELWLNSELTTMDDLMEEVANRSPQTDAFGGDLAKRGREMVMALRGELQIAICHSAEVQAHPDLSDEMADKLALAAVIAGLVPQDIGKAINATLVAAILVRIGIRRFCASGVQ